MGQISGPQNVRSISGEDIGANATVHFTGSSIGVWYALTFSTYTCPLRSSHWLHLNSALSRGLMLHFGAAPNSEILDGARPREPSATGTSTEDTEEVRER
jgi:hypothetical protein